MKLFTKLAIFGVLLASLVGCWGEKVEIPPASVGLVLGKNGYQGDLIPPSRFRLTPCVFNCDKLVVIEAGDVGMAETMNVLMPRDNLDLGVDVRFTLALSQDRGEILSVFDRVVPTRLSGDGIFGGGNFGTNLVMIYDTYGKAVVRNVVRSKLSEYTIDEIANNQGRVSEELRQAVASALEKTPLEVKQFGLASISYPATITEARESAARREIDIQRADADAQVKIREAQARLEVTRAEREADILAAQTIAEQNLILANGVTPEVLRYMELEVMKEMARNKNTIFFPLDMMGSEALDYRVLNTTTQ